MKTISGDLIKLALSGQFDVIVHGCNCFHTMGAGIAKPISTLFPEALNADKTTPYGDQQKLGTISMAVVERNGFTFHVVNAYTQFHFRGPMPRVDYKAISSCFGVIAKVFPNKRIGYPMIGAGLAGGEWHDIAPRIENALIEMDHTLVVLPK